MLPKHWLEYLQYEEDDVEITENLYSANCTPKSFFVQKDFESWNLKIHGPRNYIQSFYLASIIDECGTKKYYQLAMFRYGIYKKYEIIL